MCHVEVDQFHGHVVVPDYVIITPLLLRVCDQLPLTFIVRTSLIVRNDNYKFQPYNHT